jgi:hypothetical protein
MPPLTAGAYKVEEAIQQLSHIRGPRPPTALGGRDERLQQAKLVVRQCLAGAKIPDQRAISRRSLIAAPLSRPSFTSPARVMVLFAVSVGCRNIWSGPEDRHCKVHNGLTLITRPSPRRAIACTLALGRCVLAYLTSFDELRCHGRRGPAEWLARSPDTVQDDGQLARQGYPCLARTRASLDRLGPILQV